MPFQGLCKPRISRAVLIRKTDKSSKVSSGSILLIMSVVKIGGAC